MSYRKKNYSRNRGYGGRHHRRSSDHSTQPLPNNLREIPYSRHTMTKQDIEAVVEAMLSGTLTCGEELVRFESLLAKLTHCYHAVAFANGTAAIHAALSCLDLKSGDEVIISTLNFSALANMIRLVGATPVLVDCDSETLTMSVEAAQRAVTKKTKAIFSNNFAGHSADIQALREICDDQNLVLLDDACHGLGGRYRGHYIGNQADLTCFSFHPSKVVTTGEGGAVSTQSSDWAQRLRLFRHHGLRKSNGHEEPEYMQTQMFPGMNYRMSEMAAALGRSQLARLERHVERRRQIADFYRKNIGEMDTIILPPVADWVEHPYHLFPIQLSGSMYGKRDLFFKEMKKQQIGVQVHYVPVHRIAAHESDPGQFPNAENYFHNCLSLPVFPDMGIKDLERVVEAIKTSLERCEKLPIPQAKSPETETEEAPAKETKRKTTRRKTTKAKPKAKEDSEQNSSEAENEAGQEEKPKTTRRKTTRRTTAKKKVEPEKTDGSDTEAEEKPKKRRTTRRKKVEETVEASSSAKPSEDSAAEEKPKRKTTTRRRTTKTTKTAKSTGSTSAKTTRAKRTTKKAEDSKDSEKSDE